MRVVFVATTGFFVVLALLCLVRVAMVVPDQPAVLRWTSAALGSIFIATFWEVVRRHHVARGTLKADPVVAGLGLVGVGVLVAVGLVLRSTT